VKYLAKTFAETIPDWTPEELVFNAIAWHKGYRFFGCSRDLSKAMARSKRDNPISTWFSTTLIRPWRLDAEDIILWENPTWKNSTTE
jgi:hypothetical protein